MRLPLGRPILESRPDTRMNPRQTLGSAQVNEALRPMPADGGAERAGRTEQLSAAGVADS